MPLINALIDKGHDVWHVRVGRRNILTRPKKATTEFSGFFGFVSLIRHISVHSQTSVPGIVFVDTTGAFVPLRSLLLRASLRGFWCFDIFDNLTYDAHGFYGLKRRLAIVLLARLSPIKIVLSLETLRLFPSAHHLENAANIRRVSRVGSNFNDLVSLFMIDRRFDFELVKEVASLAPEMKVYLYGRLANADRVIKLRLEELCSSSPNVIYRGEYRFDDVEKILAPFGIGFTPYATNDLLTEFINPDKYYIYLNSGMEIISTDIPQARRMTDHIHVARSAGEVIELAARIKSDRNYRKNADFGHDFSWEKRADDLLEIIRSYRASGAITA